MIETDFKHKSQSEMTIRVFPVAIALFLILVLAFMNSL
jgi:hypothetical protein